MSSRPLTLLCCILMMPCEHKFCIPSAIKATTHHHHHLHNGSRTIGCCSVHRRLQQHFYNWSIIGFNQYQPVVHIPNLAHEQFSPPEKHAKSRWELRVLEWCAAYVKIKCARSLRKFAKDDQDQRSYFGKTVARVTVINVAQSWWY